MTRGLSLAEAYTSRQGEILDLMACEAIATGAKQKIKHTFDELRMIK